MFVLARLTGLPIKGMHQFHIDDDASAMLDMIEELDPVPLDDHNLMEKQSETIGWRRNRTS
jgi:hypothetical protein